MGVFQRYLSWPLTFHLNWTSERRLSAEGNSYPVKWQQTANKDLGPARLSHRWKITRQLLFNCNCKMTNYRAAVFSLLSIHKQAPSTDHYRPGFLRVSVCYLLLPTVWFFSPDRDLGCKTGACSSPTMHWKAHGCRRSQMTTRWSERIPDALERTENTVPPHTRL